MVHSKAPTDTAQTPIIPLPNPIQVRSTPRSRSRASPDHRGPSHHPQAISPSHTPALRNHDALPPPLPPRSISGVTITRIPRIRELESGHAGIRSQSIISRKRVGAQVRWRRGDKEGVGEVTCPDRRGAQGLGPAVTGISAAQQRDQGQHLILHHQLGLRASLPASASEDLGWQL